MKALKKSSVYLLSLVTALFVCYQCYGVIKDQPRLLASPEAAVAGYLLLFALGVLGEVYQLRQGRNDPTVDPTLFVGLLAAYSGLLLPDRPVFLALSIAFLLLYVVGWGRTWLKFRSDPKRGILGVSILLPLCVAFYGFFSHYNYFLLK